MKRFLIATSIVGALLAFAPGVTAQVGAEVALRAAIEKETVKGDLKGAIDQYKKLAQGKDRAVAAKALVHMGQCYERLGDAEARKAYERVVKEFADQKEAVAEARKHLEAKTAQAGAGPITRQIEKVGDRHYESFSKDGRFGAFTYQGARVGLHDLVTGDQKNLVVRKSPEESFLNAMISPDGKLVAYTRQTQISEILVIGTDGSNPRTLAGDQDVNARCLSWSPDGKYLLAVFARLATGISSIGARMANAYSSRSGARPPNTTYTWCQPPEANRSHSGSPPTTNCTSSIFSPTARRSSSPMSNGTATFGR